MGNPRDVVPGWTDRRLGGRVAAGNSPARAGDSSPGAASVQPPHKSIQLSISRTTSFAVYGRSYSPRVAPTTEFSDRRQWRRRQVGRIPSPTGRSAMPGRRAYGRAPPPSYSIPTKSLALQIDQRHAERDSRNRSP